jgi:hypothetical protein
MDSNPLSIQTRNHKGAFKTLKRSCSLIAILAIFLITAARSFPTPVSTVVKVTGGTVECTVQDEIFSFNGIPFAAPPVDGLRWKAPQPFLPWEGVKKTNKFAPGPMQDTSFAPYWAETSRSAKTAMT